MSLTPKYNIPYEDLAKLNAPFIEAYQSTFTRITERGWFILGQELARFEDEFAAYCDAKYCIGVANGLDALTLSIVALELPPKSEIIIPANTYIASILAILHAGHIPVLVEPDVETYLIDPNRITEALTNKTKAIMVVHLYGTCCTMEPILQIANQHGLCIIEDGAQSHGATYNGKKSGNLGTIAAHSFYPTKNLGALGDGGAITTNSEILAHRVRLLRNYGSKVKYHNELVGYNSRLDELQAAFLRIKLKHLDQLNTNRIALAEVYRTNLPNSIIVPKFDPAKKHVFHIFAIRHPERDALRKYLASEGIGTEIHYPVPPHLQPALKNKTKHGPLPITESIHNTILSLPCSSWHRRLDVEIVIGVVQRFLISN